MKTNITSILQRRHWCTGRLTNLLHTTKQVPGKKRLASASNTKGFQYWVSRELRPQGTAGCLRQLLLRPRIRCHWQPGWKLCESRVPWLMTCRRHRAGGLQHCALDSAKRKLPGGSSQATVWEMIKFVSPWEQENKKGCGRDGQCISAWASGHPLISGVHSPGHGCPQFPGTLYHDRSFPDPVTLGKVFNRSESQFPNLWNGDEGHVSGSG